MTRQRIFRALAVAYVVLLAASHLVRHRLPDDPPEVSPGKSRALLANDIQVAYREFGSQEPAFDTPVVLLHGSPGSSGDFLTLGPPLSTRFRVLAPDLPGFGDSTRQISDYSIRSHAKQVIQLLDALAIERAHIIGFSMGGGVALEISRQAPLRMQSLTLLSAIGVQELELLGDYRLNHAIHGLQLAALWALHEGLPHFGLLDGFPLDIPYARNFFDTDQRPLRAVLEGLEAPTLIVHGEHDVLVPVAAAREHRRLVPHSELVVLNEGHFMIFGKGEMLSAPILEFLSRVEATQATTRGEATTERLEAAELPFDASELPQASGMALVVLMLLLAVATFASEDLASIGTGLLIAQGRVGFFAGAAACFLGILIGDVAIYLAGRFLGRPALGRVPLRWLISQNGVERSRQWFALKGPSVIFASRFLPGTRVATYFAAGVLGTGFWRFLLYLGSAVALWVPLIVGLASVLGTRVFDLFDTFSHMALPGILSLAIVGWLVLRALKSLLTRSGRRLMIGRWQRIRHWEFWPPWIFYPPVLMKIAQLGLKHRSLTLFTAANPAMPSSGFVGESKAAILDALAPHDVARHAFVAAQLPLSERQKTIETFMTSNDLAFPVVLKPDIGQRGSGVEVARNSRQIDRYLKQATSDLLVQEYIPGVELGVFYVRLPSEREGRIFSITEKRLPEVIGNGASTLEELILDDERAVAMASVYLDLHEPELDRVPARDERVRLVDVGTHCRGAVFLDGQRFQTPNLKARVEQISRSYEGFFFGRYDLKAPSFDAFRRGEDIKVIELNGVTSEATHIYDPANSLFDAYRTLFRQWELAFEIGKRNATDGAAVTSVGGLARLLWKEWRA